MANVVDFFNTIDFTEMVPQEFEKDDDSNGHIDYIVATAVIIC